jgi:hypothetical protein
MAQWIENGQISITIDRLNRSPGFLHKLKLGSWKGNPYFYFSFLPAIVRIKEEKLIKWKCTQFCFFVSQCLNKCYIFWLLFHVSLVSV